MKLIFEINHPKHYYQFKYLIKKLQKNKHLVYVFAHEKDILLELLDQENIDYTIIGQNKNGILNKVLNGFFVFAKYFFKTLSIKPDILISKASLYSVFCAKIVSKRSIIFPDSEVVWLTNKIVVPLATTVVTPIYFGLDYGKNHKRVNGFFEECYLANDLFTPNDEILKIINLKKGERFAIVRFVGWSANHDINNKGLSINQKEKIISFLAKKMRVYITSEKKLPLSIAKYKLKIPVNLIHSALHYADLYIGDSQTMATESALLGTPSIRFNSFVGKNDMANFIILEDDLDLLKNFNSFDKLMNSLEEFVKNKESKNIWKTKSKEYLSKSISLNDVIYDIIINSKIMKKTKKT